MRSPHETDNSEYVAMFNSFEIQVEEELAFDKDWLDYFIGATEILDAKYKQISSKEQLNRFI